ncbi:MAG: hypothetical protein L0Z53_14170 [Acidobacteriales bacterium]|nr:hypothetical protein [Terriglobales bacterium]
MQKAMDELRRLEQLQADNPKRVAALQFKVRGLQAQRPDLIAASVTGDGAATAKLDKLDAEIISVLRERARADEAAIELNHAIALKKLAVLREMGEEQLAKLDSVEANLSSAVKALAKTVENACGSTRGAFEAMDKCAFGGGAGLRAPYGEIGRMLQAAFTESLQAGVASIFTGNGGHVELTKCRSLLESLVENAIAEAEERVINQRAQDRSSKNYERSQLDNFLAATAAQ